ncbi:MAG: hypothetical protein Q4G51_00805 [Dermatophilus congolensis]|nr:hypothetical protein [Dermatophilus congolensis]
MSNPPHEQSARAAEERDDTVERVTDKGAEQIESAANAESGGSHADQVAKKHQVPDPNVRPNEDK